MGNQKIRLYVDVVSPFGYLGYYMLRHSPVFSSCDVTYVPILLGGLMNACKNTPPIMIKNKDQWTARERMRWAQQFDVPMRADIPPGFPVKTLNVQRALAALQLKAPDKMPQVVDRLFASTWAPDTVKGQMAESVRKDGNFDLTNADVITALLGDVIGSELAKEVVEARGSKEAKDKLTANTNEAFNVGAFGLPWFDCTNAKGDNEGFWGFDHLGQVVRFLELDGELDKARSGQPIRALL